MCKQASITRLDKVMLGGQEKYKEAFISGTWWGMGRTSLRLQLRPNLKGES